MSAGVPSVAKSPLTGSTLRGAGAMRRGAGSTRWGAGFRRGRGRVDNLISPLREQHAIGEVATTQSQCRGRTAVPTRVLDWEAPTAEGAIGGLTATLGIST